MRAAGRHRVAAEAQQHAGVALGDQVERIAQVKAGDRAARALEQPVARRARRRRSAGAGGPSGARRRCRPRLRGSRGRTAPARRRRLRLRSAAARSSSASACSRMPASTSRRSRLMASSVCGQLGGARRVVGEQAFDAERHVGQPAGGVDARAEREAEVEGAARARRRARRPRTAPPRRAACGRRGCASGPARPGGGCWRRACTTSATVPSATRSSSASSRGCVGARRTRRARAARRAAPAARRTSRRRRRATCSRTSQPGWFGLTITSASGSTHARRRLRRQVVVGDQHLQAAARAHGPRLRGWRCRCPP